MAVEFEKSHCSTKAILCVDGFNTWSPVWDLKEHLGKGGKVKVDVYPGETTTIIITKGEECNGH
jgi:hypothetical protein